MLFNSLDFAVFLPIVFLLHWLVFSRNNTQQNLFLVAASYLFYGWWDWRYLILIFISSFADFLIGLKIHESDRPRTRKRLVTLSVVLNLGLLGFFKYFDFFVESFTDTVTFLGYGFDSWSLQIILPVGISFYTFQTMSYTIDVYRGKLVPTRDFLAFAAFVSFFPQLVAGPIERAKLLLPQILKKRRFEYDEAVQGLKQILWGLFKKVVVADGVSVYVNDIFENYPAYSGTTLLLGAALCFIQIYGDFSGYSDIAIGTARLFGCKLQRNFAYPLFSRTVPEGWTRWHISLTTWFRDYVFLSLGGAMRDRYFNALKFMIVFTLSGLWHGAAWTFVIWGFLNALLLVPQFLFGKRKRRSRTVAQGRTLPTPVEIYEMARTFTINSLLLVFFRSPTLSDAWAYLGRIFSPALFDPFDWNAFSRHGITVAPWVFLLLLLEWVARTDDFGLERLGQSWRTPVRWTVYLGLTVAILSFARTEQEFIYFQF